MKKKTFLLWAIALMLASNLLANEVQFTASAPSQVGVGQRFRVTYQVNKRPSNFEGPTSFDGFKLLGGPAQSMSSQTQWINNQMTMSESHSFTYTLEATSEGTFTIPAAKVIVDGKTLQSNNVTVVVSGQAPQQQAQPRGQQQQPQQQAPTRQTVSDTDIYIRAHSSSRNPWHGERVTLTYKLYTRVGVSQFNLEKLPSFQGFWSEDVTQPGQIQVSEEVIDGQSYTVATLKQYLVFPQRSGEIRIDPLEAQTLLRLATTRRTGSFFDEFFGGSFGGFETIERTLRSNPVVLNVKPLPTQNRPGSFNGNVGNFDLSASINTNQVDANEPVTFTISINGSGNIRMIEKPNITFPYGLEAFEPKVSDNVRGTASGISGTRSFEYLIIPRTSGTFELPPVEFSFFDPSSQKYITRKSQPFTLNVSGEQLTSSQGTPGMRQEDIQYIATDIRFINTNPFKLYPVGALFFRSTLFYALLLLPITLFVTLLFLRRRHIRLHADPNLLRNKKAERMARNRLSMAGKYLKNGETVRFYDEIFRALWGYLSNKLSIPVSKLNKQVVNEIFISKGVDADLAGKFLEALNECEYARFAPGEPIARMDETYQTAIDTIVLLEKKLKTKSKPKKQVTTVILVLIASTVLANPDPVQLLNEAKKAYLENQFAYAAELYEEVLEMNMESAELYYNLGNAYFKEGKYGPAITNYERALRLKPGHQNANFNLRVVQSRIVDNVNPVPAIFYIKWWQTIYSTLSVNNWGWMVVFSLVLALSCLGVYFFSNNKRYRKIAFAGALAFLLLMLASNLAARVQFYNNHQKKEVVIMVPRTTAKSSPSDTSPDIFVIHEGSKALVTDELDKWYEIKLANGNVGWIKKTSGELI